MYKIVLECSEKVCENPDHKVCHALTETVAETDLGAFFGLPVGHHCSPQLLVAQQPGSESNCEQPGRESNCEHRLVDAIRVG